MRVITRAEALKALLVTSSSLPLWTVSRPANAASFLQADDKSWDFSLPESWKLNGAPLRRPTTELPRLFQVRAEDASSQCQLDMTVEFAAANQKSLKDLGTMDIIAARYLERQPQPATLLEATKLPRPDMFSTSLYQFRYRVGDGGESVVKLALQQGRLYQLSVSIPAGATEPSRQEADDIVQSFKTYPLNIGCLSASNRGGSFLPGVCY